MTRARRPGPARWTSGRSAGLCRAAGPARDGKGPWRSPASPPDLRYPLIWVVRLSLEDLQHVRHDQPHDFGLAAHVVVGDGQADSGCVGDFLDRRGREALARVEGAGGVDDFPPDLVGSRDLIQYGQFASRGIPWFPRSGGGSCQMPARVSRSSAALAQLRRVGYRHRAHRDQPDSVRSACAVLASGGSACLYRLRRSRSEIGYERTYRPFPAGAGAPPRPAGVTLAEAARRRGWTPTQSLRRRRRLRSVPLQC